MKTTSCFLPPTPSDERQQKAEVRNMANSSERRKQTVTASLLITKFYKTRVIYMWRHSRTNLVPCNTQDKDKMAAGPLWATFHFLTIIHTPFLLRSESPLLHPMAVFAGGIERQSSNAHTLPGSALSQLVCKNELCPAQHQDTLSQFKTVDIEGSLLCFILWYNIKMVGQLVSRIWAMCAFVGKQSGSIYTWFIYQRISE